jgi:hypothetical protein
MVRPAAGQLSGGRTLLCSHTLLPGTHPQVGELADKAGQLSIIVNPQWELKGNLVSRWRCCCRPLCDGRRRP